MKIRGLGLPGAAAIIVALLAAAPATSAIAYAPTDRPGPPLDVAPAALAASLSCSPGLDHAGRAPVLFLNGTGATPEQNWSWNWVPALNGLGIPWCTLNSPFHTTGDVQVNGEYVVYAIRTMYARAGRPIALIGHSQGGMVGRWALRFWPDTRRMVDDVIGFAASNHGTTQVQSVSVCSGGCTPADWQQDSRAHFIAALNSYQETFAGISYTDVYTHTDEIVVPNSDSTGSSSLHTGDGMITNVATQDICPLDTYEHLGIGTLDPVAYALAIDALTHRGPADPARIDRAVCLQVLMPGVGMGPLAGDTAPLQGLLAILVANPDAAPKIPAEPPLACYVTASCPAADTGPATAGQPGQSPSCLAKRRFVVALPATLRRVTVTVTGGAGHIRRHGRTLTALIDIRRSRRSATLAIRGRNARGHGVRLIRHYRLCAGVV